MRTPPSPSPSVASSSLCADGATASDDRSMGVFTTPLRAEAVWLLAHYGAMDAEQIGQAMPMNPDKVRAILHERAEKELIADQVSALAGPFFPASQTSPETTRAERALVASSDIETAVLLELWDIAEPWWPDPWCLTLVGLRRRLGLHKEVLRGAVASLRDQGHAAYMRGLMSEEGVFIGAGYHITAKGRAHVLALRGEAGA
jgi:hypothetical protein